MSILNNKKILIIGGCEFYYLCKYYQYNKINVDIIYSYYKKTSYDPYEEILKEDNYINNNEIKYDYIIISQIYSLRKYLINIHHTNKEADNCDEIINSLNNELQLIINYIKKYQKCPIFIPTYPHLRLNLYGLFDYKYNSTDILIKNFNNMILNFCSKVNNTYLYDIDDILKNLEDTIQMESKGGHLTLKGGELIAYYLENIINEVNKENFDIIIYNLDDHLTDNMIKNYRKYKIEIKTEFFDDLYKYSLKEKKIFGFTTDNIKRIIIQNIKSLNYLNNIIVIGKEFLNDIKYIYNKLNIINITDYNRILFYSKKV